MSVLVRFVTRRPKGGVSIREDRLELEDIGFGRGTDCAVYLPDPRMAFHHARLRKVEKGWQAEAEADQEILIGNRPRRSAALAPGESFGIGPYEVRLLAPDPGGEDALVLEVELIRPMADAYEQVRAATKGGLAGHLPSKRVWSWVWFCLISGLFLVMPVWALTTLDGKEASRKAVVGFDEPWISGELSDGHKHFGRECGVCHKPKAPLTRVGDSACTECHKSAHPHIRTPEFRNVGLTAMACVDCHEEHRGPKGSAMKDPTLCVACHGDIQKVAAGAPLANVPDVAHHPDFRVTVSAIGLPPGLGRPRKSMADFPKEGSGLQFPHKLHLDAQRMEKWLPPGKLPECADCHQPDAGGALMKPIRMKDQCASCHRLEWNPDAPDRVLPHGEPLEVAHIIRDFYTAQALRGEVAAEDAPPIVRTRRRPGAHVTPAEQKEILFWADQEIDRALRHVFGKAVCGGCHKMEIPVEGLPEIEPVRLQTDYMPKSEFSHRSHDTVLCVQCHSAVTSTDARDVLMPHVQDCRSCHGEPGSQVEVPSECTECHLFHMPPDRAAVKPEGHP